MLIQIDQIQLKGVFFIFTAGRSIYATLCHKDITDAYHLNAIY